MNNTIKTITLALVAMMTVTLASAQEKPTGTIETSTGGKVEGTIRWLNASKKYVVSSKNRDTELAEADVVDITVKKPKALDPAIANIKRGAKLPDSIKTLQTIADDYAHLTWDVEASRWLADAYMRQGRAAEAVKACETLVRSNEELGYKGEIAVMYWRALLKDGKSARMAPLLEKAAASGDSYSAAFALLLRGDAAMAKGSAAANCREALMDGYLRVILLYGGVADAMPEALSKAAKAFDGMSQATRASALRKRLKDEYPTSEWVNK